MSGIYNHDGAPFEPPRSLEYDAYIKSIICDKGGFGYHCMYCNKCIYGDYFKPSSELQVILDEHAQMIEQYAKQHNPNGITDILITFNAE